MMRYDFSHLVAYSRQLGKMLPSEEAALLGGGSCTSKTRTTAEETWHDLSLQDSLLYHSRDLLGSYPAVGEVCT